MNPIIKKNFITAGLWLAAATSGLAGNDLLIGGSGRDYKIAFDPEVQLLLVCGDERDNRIEVGLAEDGSLMVNGAPVLVSDVRLTARNTAAVALYGGAGNDVLIADQLPQAAMCGGDGRDYLIWQRGYGDYDGTSLGQDYLIWQTSLGEDGYGGAGLDILIGNTGGDRLGGDLGQDWIVGGTNRDTSYGGWGNDLMNADDVFTSN